MVKHLKSRPPFEARMRHVLTINEWSGRGRGREIHHITHMLGMTRGEGGGDCQRPLPHEFLEGDTHFKLVDPLSFIVAVEAQPDMVCILFVLIYRKMGGINTVCN